MSALRQAERQLVLADRLSAVGQMAAGVAHELNNPLAYVSANVDFVRIELRGSTLPDEQRREIESALHDAADGTQRLTAIVRGLKAFSRVDDDQRSAVDVAQVVESSLRMASNELKHRARVITHIEDVPPVIGNAGRLGQVVLNLLINAAQAIPEGNVAANVVEARVRRGSAARVIIEVRDSGAGIPPEILERIFDPFFTTKPIGVGTGLGLSICHGIVSSLGGEIRVESAVGRGTCFSVSLPAAEEQGNEARRPEPATPAAGPGLRVLVIDDDPRVGSALRRLLGKAHRVDWTGDAREAVPRLLSGEPFDLVLCDLMMPEMTGMDFHQALAAAPTVRDRVVYMTGGAFTTRARSFIDSFQGSVLEKPFSAEGLRELLRRRAPARALCA